MKLIKKLMAVALCAAVALGVMCIPAKAEAAGRTTFTIKYNGTGWSFYSSLEADNTWKGVGVLGDYFNDGDVIVISGEDTNGTVRCDLTISKRIGELCTTNNAFASVYANGGCDFAYAVGNSTLVVNGNVTRAAASNNGVLQVNGNVSELEVNYPDFNKSTDNDPVFAVTGKVATAKIKINSEQGYGTYYNIAAGKCMPDKFGILWLEDGEYSKTGVASSTATASTSTSTSTAKTEKKLDDVPKTGSTGMATSMAFFAMAAVLAVSAVAIKRREQ